MKIVIIGGGAAGFFAALTCAQAKPDYEVLILEKSPKLLAKVKVSGGGRCNVTNAEQDPSKLVKFYPRGAKELRNAFNIFSSKDTVQWFEKRGVKLKAEPDGRMFPVTDDSQTIIDCLLQEAQKLGVKIQTSTSVMAIEKEGNKFIINTTGPTIKCNKILIATGGNPNPQAYKWLADLGHEIIPPIPSLFTFNCPNSKLNGLMGVAVEHATAYVAGDKKTLTEGPLLITHWGFSGPAVLKLSAWQARKLYDLNYNFTASLNWLPNYSEDSLRVKFLELKSESKKMISSCATEFNLPKRLWENMLQVSEISPELRWAELPKKNMNKLIQELINGQHEIKGKTTFKEEFVTCGGVSLKDVNMTTMESKKYPGIYFAGEVLDIDGLTGGFNFQAAWTTGFIAGKGMAELS